jgi:hypothetical protein
MVPDRCDHAPSPRSFDRCSRPRNLLPLGLLIQELRDRAMWTRWMCVAGMCLGIAPPAETGELHRMSCTIVRFYVARYSAPAAETWARSKGATDVEIEAARHCLKDSPVQTATVLNTAAH